MGHGTIPNIKIRHLRNIPHPRPGKRTTFTALTPHLIRACANVAESVKTSQYAPLRSPYAMSTVSASADDKASGPFRLCEGLTFPSRERVASPGRLQSQRVHLDCQYGIRSQKPYMVWFWGPNSIWQFRWTLWEYYTRHRCRRLGGSKSSDLQSNYKNGVYLQIKDMWAIMLDTLEVQVI